MDRIVTEGRPEPLGVTPHDGGVNVAVFSAHADAIEFCLFGDTGEIESGRIALVGRSGDVFHAHIAGVATGARYGLRAHGPYAPERGHRFNPAKLLVDPYALALDRRFAAHASQLGFANGDPYAHDARNADDSAAFVPKAIVVDRASLTSAAAHVRVPWSETIIYELHVRGFTRLHPDIPESIRGTFAALAQPAAIAHLRTLGITSVELMPAAAWMDERHLPALGLSNYWGYNPIAMLAPDPHLAPGGWAEVRHAIDALHRAGLEVILDVVLNHSGESDEFGATLSLRGLDNATYYRLRPDAPQHYVNDTGCGNCLALAREPVVRLALAALRAWVEYGGIDGFRFDLGTTLGRRDEGFDAHAPLLAAIAADEVLRAAKLIVEPWDVGPGGHRLGQFPSRYAEWNDRFRDDVRRYWRGDADASEKIGRGALATRLAGSADVFSAKGAPSRGINFITAHDGFTLADLVTYSGKHNEANGEQNRDGANDNHSWNHGVEGPAADAAVVAARMRDQRNLLATLVLAHGTPMLSMGDEIGTSRHGNNNAYAQDNETSWLAWSTADRPLLAFAQRLIALRRAHPALRADRFLDGAPLDESGIVDVEWRSGEGELRGAADWERSGDDMLVAVFYAARDGGGNADRVAIVFQPGNLARDIELPEARAGFAWRRALDTSSAQDSSRTDSTTHACIEARSVVVFVEEAARDNVSRTAARASDERDLARLADAAGIARGWWDVGGQHHEVTSATLRALLAAMGLPAETTPQARASLDRITQQRERRLLPHTLAVRLGEAAQLAVTVAGSRTALARDALVICDETDATVATPRVPLAFDAETQDAFGRRLRKAFVALPPLPAGRYVARLDSAADTSCRITVAPHACHLPESVLNGERRFGISAQLYALRSARDGGIGDFTTLTEGGAAAARFGAVMLGVNPLHMLFPGARERASPYHPSDRRFLDPIYIDIEALQDVPGFAEAISPLGEGLPHDARSRAASDAVDYAAVWETKQAFLERLFAAFERVVRAQPDALPVLAFADFIAAGGDALASFATFEAIAASHADQAWCDWPGDLRDARSRAVADFARTNAPRVRHAMFLQWLADRQLAAASARAREAGLVLGLYRDLAVGCAPDGAEAWSNAALFARGASIGAPPDPLGPDGQVWNLPPPNPLTSEATGHRAFRNVVAANMRHAGALRIDHVLGLSRLFWIPSGGKAADGTYVNYPLDALIAETALESARARCLVVGEDLGTVPDGLRERLADAGMLSYRVMLLERRGPAFVAAHEYPGAAVACAATHDLPPLAGWWQGADLHERRALGLIDDAALSAQLAVRREEKRELLRAVAAGGDIDRDIDAPWNDALLVALHAWLASAPSTLMLVQAEDIAGETIGQNLPGTDRERPNWRRRLPASLAELLASPRAQRIRSALDTRTRRTD